MKNLVPLMLVVLCLTATGDPAKLGSLNRESDVVVEGLFPAFQIWVPNGVTEVQIRASVNNFQNSFRLVKTGAAALDLTYRCLGTRNGKNYYKVDGSGPECFCDANGWFSVPTSCGFPQTRSFHGYALFLPVTSPPSWTPTTSLSIAGARPGRTRMPVGGPAWPMETRNCSSPIRTAPPHGVINACNAGSATRLTVHSAPP